MMRPISRSFLAQQLTHELAAAECRGQGDWWSEQEAGVEHASTAGDAAAAARAAIAVCDHCPVWLVCAERAELDRYDGIAAGAIYRNGTRIEVHAVAAGNAVFAEAG